MTTFEVFIAIYMGLLAPAFAALVSSRLKRLETGIDNLRGEVKGEIVGLRAELKADIAELRAEIGAQRSDLTQVALAVGVRKPQASEG